MTLKLSGDGTVQKDAESPRDLQGVARSWINFNGTGTIATRDSFNVSSLTDSGTGNYSVSMTVPAGNSGFYVGMTGDSAAGYLIAERGSMRTSSRYGVGTFNNAAANEDCAYVNVAVFGD